jgi:hypothetical protein
VQWGAPIGKHAAIADRIARMAANTFAMEAMTLYTASLVDRDKKADIRLEAAMCKMWGSEVSWEIVNDTMQIRGGRGYETADSLRARGDEPAPVERLFRDSRINAIFEGSSEIMRLFLAREALDPHLKIAAPVLNSRLPVAERIKAALKAGWFYARWYPRQFLPWFGISNSDGRVNPVLRRHLRYAARTSRRLARRLFQAMLVHGPKLDRQQVLLGRFVDIGTELFAIAATCSRAQSLLGHGDAGRERETLELVDYFCRSARLRIGRNFAGLRCNTDRQGYRLAQEVLAGKHNWLEEGTVGRMD